MLQASWERPVAGAGSMWVPGMTPGLMDAGSARAQEVARWREMVGTLHHDLPESEYYDLSLTDLVVEKAGAAEATERKEPEHAGRSASGRLTGQQVQQQQQPQTAGRPDRRESARLRDSGNGSSFRSSSDGVLLNFYMPRCLTRSCTAPRPSRTPSISGGRTSSVASDCRKRVRDADADTVKCWSLLWNRPWRKSHRRDTDARPDDHVRAAIIKAAKHLDSPAEV